MTVMKQLNIFFSSDLMDCSHTILCEWRAILWMAEVITCIKCAHEFPLALNLILAEFSLLYLPSLVSTCWSERQTL